METGQLFSWEALSAMGGASLLTFFIVQYSKALIDRFAAWLPTDLYAVIVAWVILTLAQIAIGTDATDWRVYALAFANAFLIAAAAGQMQHKVINTPGAAKEVNSND